MPEIVVGHVRGKLELDEDVPAAHESDRTLWRHRDPVAATAYRLGHPIPSSHPIRSHPGRVDERLDLPAFGVGEDGVFAALGAVEDAGGDADLGALPVRGFRHVGEHLVYPAGCGRCEQAEQVRVLLHTPGRSNSGR